MRDATATAGRPSPPDPHKDQAGKPVPERIAALLNIVAILLAYGRHLAETLERRSGSRGFSTIAQFFGTANRTTILLHLQRGILRAVALERMLQARATRGRDLVVLKPHAAPRRSPPLQAPPAASGTPAATARRSRRDEPFTAPTMLRLASIEAEVRRRPMGSSIADICRDLGVSPSLCAGPFWYAVSLVFQSYRGSITAFLGDMRRRETRFAKELDRTPGAECPEQTREAMRRVLGFFIGEIPVGPPRGMPPEAAVASRATGFQATAVACAAAAATGPP